MNSAARQRLPPAAPRSNVGFLFSSAACRDVDVNSNIASWGLGVKGPGQLKCEVRHFFFGGLHGWIDDAFEGEVDRIPARCCFCNFCRLLSRIAVSQCAEAHVDVSSAFSAHRYVELLFSFSLLVPTTWPVKCILSAVVAEPACPTEAGVFLEVRACPCCLSNKE